MASYVYDIGFGVEIETAVKPNQNRELSSTSHYANFAKILKQDYNLDAVGNHTSYKYPRRYDKWWITADTSIDSSDGFST